MILRHCKTCRRDRALSNAACSCGFTDNGSDTFKAVVVVPGSKGKRRSKTAATMEGAREAEGILRSKLQQDQEAYPWVFQETNPKQAPHQEPLRSPQEALTIAYGGVKCATLDEIWKTYRPYVELRNRSYKADIQRYRDYLKGPLGKKPADQIRPADIQGVIDDCIRKGKAPSTTLKVFALVRAMLNYADRMELTHGLQNPCRKVQVPKFDNRVNNPPTPEDFGKLMDACNSWENQHAARVVLFCAYSGRRMGEVLKLEWNDIDLSGAMVRFRAANTKSGKVQTIPVNEKALEVLRKAQEHRVSRWVFPCSTGKYFSGFHVIWQRIRRAAKMSRHYRFHDLRHGFASTLVSNGVSLYIVKELLGHADIKTTERYAHLATGALREAAGVMCMEST